MKFEDRDSLQEHRKIHEAEGKKKYVRVKPTFRCDLCDYTCTNEKLKFSHMNNKHQIPIESTEKHPLLKCDVSV